VACHFRKVVFALFLECWECIVGCVQCSGKGVECFFLGKLAFILEEFLFSLRLESLPGLVMYSKESFLRFWNSKFFL